MSLLSHCVLINPSCCPLQRVSASRKRAVFPCPYKSLPLFLSVCECSSIAFFALLTCSVLFVLADSEVFSCTFLLSVFSYFSSKLQVISNKLTSFYSDVLSLLFCSVSTLLMDVQPRLRISSINKNHLIIGTFPLSASVPSNFRNSHNSYFGVCLRPFGLALLSNS